MASRIPRTRLGAVQQTVDDSLADFGVQPTPRLGRRPGRALLDETLFEDGPGLLSLLDERERIATALPVELPSILVHDRFPVAAADDAAQLEREAAIEASDEILLSYRLEPSRSAFEPASPPSKRARTAKTVGDPFTARSNGRNAMVTSTPRVGARFAPPEPMPTPLTALPPLVRSRPPVAAMPPPDRPRDRDVRAMERLRAPFRPPLPSVVAPKPKDDLWARQLRDAQRQHHGLDLSACVEEEPTLDLSRSFKLSRSGLDLTTAALALDLPPGPVLVHLPHHSRREEREIERSMTLLSTSMRRAGRVEPSILPDTILPAPEASTDGLTMPREFTFAARRERTPRDPISVPSKHATVSAAFAPSVSVRPEALSASVGASARQAGFEPRRSRREDQAGEPSLGRWQIEHQPRTASRSSAVLQSRTNLASGRVRERPSSSSVLEDSQAEPRPSVKPAPFAFSLSRSERKAAAAATDPTVTQPSTTLPPIEPVSRKRPRETIAVVAKPFNFAVDRRAMERAR